MMFEALIARPLMSLAEVLAPQSRAEWSSAMRQEFNALQDGPGSLAWAFGCVANSFGWRAKAEAPFVLSLILASLIGWAVLGRVIFYLLVELFYPNWVGPMGYANTLLQAVACLGLAWAWPRRAALIGIIVPLIWQFGAATRFFLLLMGEGLQDPWTLVGNAALPAILFPFVFLIEEMWAGVLGAAAGWGLSRPRRVRSSAA